jgi:hypothetical protein
MKVKETISTYNLVALGCKRQWVPMWLWTGLLFRFGLYDGWPFSWMFYVRYPAPISMRED